MADWADIEAELSGLTERGVPCETQPVVFEVPPWPTPLLPPSEVQRARSRHENAQRRARRDRA